MNKLTKTNAEATELTATEQTEIDSIKNLAIAKIDTLNEIKEKRKAKREMLTDSLREDETYAELEAAAKDYKKRLDAQKAVLMTNPTLAGLEADIKELNREYNETKNDVGDYLVMYADKTGQLSFLHPNGDEIKIQRSAKAKIIVNKKKPESESEGE